VTNLNTRKAAIISNLKLVNSVSEKLFKSVNTAAEE